MSALLPDRASTPRNGATSTEPPASVRGKAQPDVSIGRRYELIERDGVDGRPPAQLHVPHAFAGALQKAGRVVQRRPVEEADVRMRAEGVDVAKGGVTHAGRGMTVVQKLLNIHAAFAHALEPRLGQASQLLVGRGEPGVDPWVAPHGARKPHELAHQGRLPRPPVMSSRFALPTHPDAGSVRRFDGYSRRALQRWRPEEV